MLSRLEEIETKYESILARIAQPETALDGELFRSLMKEQSNLAELVEKYREYKEIKKNLEDAAAIAREEADGEMKAMALEECKICREKLDKTEKELKILLLPKDPNDEKNVIMEIRAGAGGQEAALFAHSLHRMYTMYAESKGWRCEVMNINETELGGVKEVSFLIEGQGAYSRLKFEGGVHRVQRVPETESQGRIQTSTCTVAVLPEAEDVELEIKDSDIKLETMKSSGAGGQHINKTESAVRLIHIPTGMVVECREERSQYKNKDKAMRLLRSRLLSAKQAEQDEEISSARRSMVGTGDRSEKIRTYNFPQSRVSDHRISLTLYTIDSFMDGNLDTVIDALLTADNAQKLSGSAEE